MNTAIRGRTGKFLHDPEWKCELRFAGKGKVERSFSLVIASAEDAGGMVGPEYNGIAILDNDNLCVVSDRVLRQASGYYGPSEAQKAEFERIRGMGWNEFSAYCRALPRFRGAIMPDIDRQDALPDEGNRVAQLSLGLVRPMAGDIRTTEMKAAHDDPACPYGFPPIGREEAIAKLAGHAVYRGGHYRPYRLAWNIKMTMDYDSSGKAGENRVDPAFDRQWDEAFEKDGSIFDRACSGLLRPYLEGEFSVWPGAGQGRWEFETDGTSGGYLVLSKVDGKALEFSDMLDFSEQLDAMSDRDLAELVMAVSTLDADLDRSRIARAFEGDLNFIRGDLEEQWSREMAVEP